jgi:hypothetical protein
MDNIKREQKHFLEKIKAQLPHLSSSLTDSEMWFLSQKCANKFTHIARVCKKISRTSFKIKDVTGDKQIFKEASLLTDKEYQVKITLDSNGKTYLISFDVEL